MPNRVKFLDLSLSPGVDIHNRGFPHLYPGNLHMEAIGLTRDEQLMACAGVRPGNGEEWERRCDFVMRTVREIVRIDDYRPWSLLSKEMKVRVLRGVAASAELVYGMNPVVVYEIIVTRSHQMTWGMGEWEEEDDCIGDVEKVCFLHKRGMKAG